MESSPKEETKTKITVKKKIIPKNKTLKKKLIDSEEDIKSIKEKEEEKEMEKTKSIEKKIYNEEFINLLNQLKEIQTALGENFRATAYSKAEEELIKYPENIYSVEQIKSLPNIGKTIIEKLNEYVKTGKLNAIEKEKNNPIIFLTKIHGIGPKKAQELIEKGITSIEDLKKNEKLLNPTQRIGLKYFEEINQPIPRTEIEKYKTLFTKIFNESTPEGSSFEIVGSYRRGAKNSGDIDIIITNKDNNISAYSKFIAELIKKKIIIEVLTKGSTKSLTITRLPNDPSAIARRVDFLYAPPDEYPFAVLYFTGSKYFNIMMRHQALEKGFSLNEHGLTQIINKKKTEPLQIKFPNEKAIFEFLNIKYKKPEDRKNIQSIEIIKEGDKDEEEDEEEQEEDKKNPKKIDKSPKEKVESPKEKVESPKEKIKIKPKRTTLKKKPISELQYLETFLKEGISGLKKLSEKELTDLIVKANDEYYCKSNPIMTDNEYDILREYIIKTYPDNIAAKNAHASCKLSIERNKVKLPYQMWSMDKIKADTKAIEKWTKKYKGPYVISAKLDGMSALYSSENGIKKLYTRGNGIEGYDISYFIPYLKLPGDENITIRGELIISKSNFKKYEKQKTKSNKDIANARNLVAGIINQKTIEPEKLKDIDFVAYEVIKPIMVPSKQMKLLESINIDTVINLKEEKISNEKLSEILMEWREDYKYEIDGIICINDEIYPRPKGNPEYAFAFKMVLSDQIAEAKVIDILWTPTKDGYLSPRVQIEPVKLKGSTINFITGKNAKFIEENKIGTGAIIQLIKAGDVIPEIYSVIQPATEPLMPSEDYEWNDTHVEIMLKDKKDDERVLEKNIETFFKALEVEGLGPGNIHRIIAKGYNSVPLILSMELSDFLKIEGFKKKLAEKIYNNIKKRIEIVTLPELMVGSNIFGRGFGEKKFELILNYAPDILISDLDTKEKIKVLNKIPGLAQKTSEKFVEKIPEFLKFLKDANLENKLYIVNEIIEDKIIEHPLNNSKIVTSGFRFKKEIVDKLKKIGAEVQNTLTKKSNILVIKDEEEESNKITEAKKNNTEIITFKEFITKYDIN